MSAGVEFFFHGDVVGEFTGAVPLVEVGRYAYMPFRGSGHYAMQTALRAGLPARCEIPHASGHVTIEVIGCPEYGVLEIGAVHARSGNQE
jgi:hypothetical protein